MWKPLLATEEEKKTLVKASAKPVKDLDKADIIGGCDLHIGVGESLNSTFNILKKNYKRNQEDEDNVKQYREQGEGASPSLTPLPRLPILESHRWSTDTHPRLWPTTDLAISSRSRAQKHGATSVGAKLGDGSRRRTLIKLVSGATFAHDDLLIQVIGKPVIMPIQLEFRETIFHSNSPPVGGNNAFPAFL